MFTKQGWTEGWRSLGCDNIAAMQAAAGASGKLTERLKREEVRFFHFIPYTLSLSPFPSHRSSPPSATHLTDCLLRWMWMLGTQTFFKSVYLYAFDFAKAPGQRSIPVDNAKAFWGILLPLVRTVSVSCLLLLVFFFSSLALPCIRPTVRLLILERDGELLFPSHLFSS